MTKLAVFLTPGFADWECALAMSAARTYYGMQVITIAQTSEPLISAGGLTITPDASLNDIDIATFDALLIPGGSVWATDTAPDITDLLHKAKAADILIAAICDANLALAKAGLLNDTAHTANAREALDAIPSYHGQSHYQDVASAVSTPKLITAAGTAPISFTREIMTRLGQGGDELNFYCGLYAHEHQHAQQQAA